MHSTTAAIVGTGFIGPVHLEALRRLGIPVHGILGSTPQKSAQAAHSLGLARGYDTYDQLLCDDEINVVHLTSPNYRHHRQVLAALEAGKHVVCEKPLAMTSAQTCEIVAASRARPQQICAVNYNVRFYPICLQARALVKNGALGRIFHLHGSYVQDWLLYNTDFNWRVLASEGGELRAVGDIGTHWLDLVEFVTGLEIESVFADLGTVHQTRFAAPQGSVETFSCSDSAPVERTPVAIDTEDFGSILLRFKGGTKGVLTVSQVVAGRKNSIRLEIAGEKMALAFDAERPNELWIGKRDEPNLHLLRDPALLDSSATAFTNYPGGHNEGFPDTFKQLYRAIYADIAAGKPSENPLYATFEDGHREILLCEAILKSHREGTWISLPN